MGACFIKRETRENTIYSKVQKIVEDNGILDLEFISRTEEFIQGFENINTKHFIIKDLQVNLLGLSLLYGSFDCFIFTHKVLKASLEPMERLFLDQKTSAIDEICIANCPEILDYYLPYYEKSYISRHDIEDVTESLDLSNNAEETKPKSIVSTYTPIQKSCELGYINMISHIYKYFKDKNIPFTLDIDYQDDSSGENCPLIACRTGNYTMIRFLYETCKGNFRVLNKQGENAVQILAASNKNKKLKDFYDCLAYLVINVGVDFSHNCEETLLLLESEKCISFFQRKLKEKGIEINKREIEEKYKLVKVEQAKSLEERKLDDVKGKMFNFTKLFNDLMQESCRDEISCIDGDSQVDVSFSSEFGEIQRS
ncbi:hypothetical protein SteCoe_33592 [Stentor coeruleus]|uniref:DUF3447 domain-containing protein n=1 Tax=Stentor coeruleus TaxID=5963 RepID=A0A1R2AWD4_9CILI|nr:hypothetical protein SteCoe_33592 [Stentor coeruleus]